MRGPALTRSGSPGRRGWPRIESGHVTAVNSGGEAGVRGGRLQTVIRSVAERTGKTPAQVVLRWHIQRGDILFPKSVTPDRIRENIDIFGFELSAADVEDITVLNKNERTGPDPDKFDGR